MNDGLHDWKTGALLVVKCSELVFAITAEKEVTFDCKTPLVFLGFTDTTNPHVPKGVFDDLINGKPTIVYKVLSPKGIVWREVTRFEDGYIGLAPEDNNLLVVER